MRIYLFLISLAFATYACASYAQTPPSLTITYPEAGKVVKPGNLIEVVVEGKNLPLPAIETVEGWDPIISVSDMIVMKLTGGLRSAGETRRFILYVPGDTIPGPYQITATLSSAKGHLFSSPITITVPQTVVMDSLKPELPYVDFYNFRDTARLGFDAMSRGKIKILENKWFTFQSLNPEIATVDANGDVTPLSNGQTQIISTYPAIPEIGQKELKAIAKVNVHVTPASIAATTALAMPPTFTPAGGTFTAPQMVTLSTRGSFGATIYYTTDGTTPNTNSQIYKGPIAVVSSETIKAFAGGEGYIPSGLVEMPYTINIATAPPQNIQNLFNSSP